MAALGPRRLYAGLLACALAAGVGAETRSPRDAPARSLATEEAVDLALVNSRQLQSLNRMVDIQGHRSRAGRRPANPELRIRNLSYRDENELLDEMEIGLRWRPPTLGAAAERRRQGQVRLWERKVDARRARDWLASRVRRACADVSLHRELVEIAEARIDNETRRISQIKTMVDLGRRSIVYYTKAKMAVNQAKNERTRQLRSLGEEERRLQRLTGVDSVIEVVAEPLPEVDLDWARLLAVAYAHRPEVSLVEAQQRLAAQQHRRERQQRWPWFSFVEISHHREPGSDDWRELMFGIEMPLFGRNGDRIQATQLGIARKEIQALAIRERIEDEVYDTFSAYEEARLAWRLARDDGEVLTAEASRVIAEATAHGTIHTDEILELERAIMDTRVIVAQRRRDLAHTLYLLWYALGTEEPRRAAPPGDR